MKFSHFGLLIVVFIVFSCSSSNKTGNNALKLLSIQDYLFEKYCFLYFTNNNDSIFTVISKVDSNIEFNNSKYFEKLKINNYYELTLMKIDSNIYLGEFLGNSDFMEGLIVNSNLIWYKDTLKCCAYTAKEIKGLYIKKD